MKVSVFLFTVVMFMFTSSAVVEAEKEPFWDIYGVEISFMPADAKINNMPLEVRDVPIHPDDKYVSRAKAGPVERKKYSIPWTLMFDVSLRKDFNEIMRFGLKFNWILSARENALRNYTNSVGTEKRGYGAALTFAGLKKGGIIPSTGIGIVDFILPTPEILLEFSGKKKELFLGISASYYKLQAINGWDRWDSLETKDIFTLSHVFPSSIYLKYKWLEVGVRYPLVVYNTDLGDKAEVKTNPSAYVVISKSWSSW